MAGPVVVGAVLLTDADRIMAGLSEVLGRPPADSKQLTRLQRERAAAWLRSQVRWGLGEASAAEVEELGIMAACTAASGRALLALAQPLTAVTADAGLKHPFTGQLPTTWHVRGDESIPQILCASIIAKVARDEQLRALATFHPHYGWERNVGYGTAEHRRAIRLYGRTVHHRFITRAMLEG